MAELNRLSVDEMQTARRFPVAVVLDNVRSLYNVGSVFRNCDAFAVSTLCLCGITGHPPHREIQKTALGATETVQWKYYQHTIDCVSQLKQDGFKVFAIEQTHGSIQLQDIRAQIGEKNAFIFGNEVEGINEKVLECCDACIEIPQYGTKHSLNVAVSCGVVLWHYTATQC